MNSTATARSSSTDQILSRLAAARAHSDELFEIVRPEALYDRPIAERHRIIFYIGHLEAFDWNLLAGPLGLSSLDPVFDKLFAFGIDPVGGGLPSDQPKDWPTIKQVHRYTERLREGLGQALAALALDDPGLSRLENGRLLEVAIEHRLMHAETLCYMLHQLPLDRKFSRDVSPLPPSPVPVSQGIEIPAGVATIGLPRGGSEAFGWDNEFEQHQVEVPAFVIDSQNVTNRDYLRFMLEGGYENRDLWTDAGWEWITSQDRKHAAFWVHKGDEWSYRTMFDEIPIPLDWPVYVSHDEAAAYCRWAGKELPSEAEWHRAACGTRGRSERAYPWGAEAPSLLHGNFDLRRWDPVPIGSYPMGASDFGVDDLVGNGWEWTRTPFAPFPGFHPFSFYRGYSADFFDGKHFVMKGGSPRTAASMLRRTFRNWFQPHYPYVYATFRGVKR